MVMLKGKNAKPLLGHRSFPSRAQRLASVTPVGVFIVSEAKNLEPGLINSGRRHRLQHCHERVRTGLPLGRSDAALGRPRVRPSGS